MTGRRNRLLVFVQKKWKRSFVEVASKELEKVRKANVVKKHSRSKYTELILIKIEKIGSVAGILEKLEILDAAQQHPYSTSSGPPGKLGLRPLL